MLFKFPLPGPLKGKLLPKEGLDGDRLRAGWVSAWGSGLGSWSGFRAGVPGWALRGSQGGLRFGAELGLGLGFLVWVPRLDFEPGFRAGVSGLAWFRAWFLREKLRFGAGLVSQRKSAFGANRNIYRQVW